MDSLVLCINEVNYILLVVSIFFIFCNERYYNYLKNKSWEKLGVNNNCCMGYILEKSKMGFWFIKF